MRSSKGGKRAGIGERLLRPAAGIEAEFSLLLDDGPALPEVVFGTPMGFIRQPLMHRTGRSFHLPNGAAIYFDTGVMELATPAMELERGCFGRLARSLAEAIRFVRAELDAWEFRTGRRVRLQGFSAHYNVSLPSFFSPAWDATRMNDIAWLLAHLLPAPVMMLATNARSTGVGVRPRARRIEVTLDYTPDILRTAATGATIAGIVHAVCDWPHLHVDSAACRGLPVFGGFRPIRHTSRRGWLARFDCYPSNPFACQPDVRQWDVGGETMTLREVAARVFRFFDGRIRALSDTASYRVARDVIDGRTPSWLGAHDRPALYDDVGRDQAPIPDALTGLGLSRYERVLRLAVDQRPLLINGQRWMPVRVRGWTRVQLRRERDGAHRLLSLDVLADRLASRT